MLGPRASLAHACCDTLGVVCPPEVRGSRSAGALSSSNIPQTCDLEYFVCAQPNCDVTEDRTHGLPCSQGRFETHCGRLNRTGTVCEEPKKSTLRGTTFPARGALRLTGAGGGQGGAAGALAWGWPNLRPGRLPQTGLGNYVFSDQTVQG